MSEPVMAVHKWSEMDESARADLLERGVRAIFDPQLMDSISDLVDDVAARGDQARRKLHWCEGEP